MAEAKLDIKIGNISFSGEGDGTWLASQLDKILGILPELQIHDSDEEGGSDESENTGEGGAVGQVPKTATLASFLKERKATSNQARKFLATALWLQDTQDFKRLETKDVTKALNDDNQGRLGNAAQSLIHNTMRGMVVKDGKKFYVAEEGRQELAK